MSILNDCRFSLFWWPLDFVNTGNSHNPLFNSNSPTPVVQESEHDDRVETQILANATTDHLLNPSVPPAPQQGSVSDWQPVDIKASGRSVAHGQQVASGTHDPVKPAAPTQLASEAQTNTQASASFVSAVGSYGSGVRAQVFEVIVRQALAGTQWREICAVPMQSNNISPQEVEAEVKRRQALLKK